MTEWVKREHSEGRHILYIEWDAIEQLQREVDALKVKAAPTPVEDEVTPEMCAAASRTWDKQTSWSSAATWTAVYRAMRAAAAPAPTPEPSAELAALRARCERLAAVACRAIALRIPAWLEPQMAGVELEGARVCRLRDALLALHPGDTEAG